MSNVLIMKGNTILSAAGVLKRRVDFIEDGGMTQRVHTMPLLMPQNVAAHSAGVAWWCYLLCNGAPSADLLMAALMHDLAEHVTGDIPSPTKWAMGLVDACEKYERAILDEAHMPDFMLQSAEARILKLADSFELMQLCIRERVMGSRVQRISDMFGKLYTYTASLVATTVEEDAFNILVTKWESLK